MITKNYLNQCIFYKNIIIIQFIKTLINLNTNEILHKHFNIKNINTTNNTNI